MQYSRNAHPNVCTRNPVICFFEVGKTSVDIFSMLPKFLEI